MRRKVRIVLIAGLVALTPMLAGCADFDMDSLDFLNLNQKKKLPGDRKEVFPGGVPGVTQGIPPEYLKGNQQQADTALTPDAAAAPPPPAGANPPAAKTAAIAPAEEPKPKAKPKPRAAKPAPTRVTIQPAAQGQGGGEQKLEPWPASAPQSQQQPAPAAGSDPWLSAPPPPSTMSR